MKTERVAAIALLPVVILYTMVVFFMVGTGTKAIDEAGDFCRDGEVHVYNLRRHRDLSTGEWTPDDESQHKGAVPVVWCDSSGVPATLTQDDKDAYGISLERP